MLLPEIDDTKSAGQRRKLTLECLDICDSAFLCMPWQEPCFEGVLKCCHCCNQKLGARRELKIATSAFQPFGDIKSIQLSQLAGKACQKIAELERIECHVVFRLK